MPSQDDQGPYSYAEQDAENQRRAVLGPSIPFASAQREEFATKLIGFGNLTDDIEHRLRGEVVINGEWILPKGGRARMTDEGIHEIMEILGSLFHHTTKTAYISEPTMHRMLFRIERSLLKWLYEKSDAYGVRTNDWDIIVSTIMFNLENALSSSVEGSLLRSIQTFHRQLETHFQSSRDGNSGVTGGLMNSLWEKK